MRMKTLKIFCGLLTTAALSYMQHILAVVGRQIGLVVVLSHTVNSFFLQRSYPPLSNSHLPGLLDHHILYAPLPLIHCKRSHISACVSMQTQPPVLKWSQADVKFAGKGHHLFGPEHQPLTVNCIFRGRKHSPILSKPAARIMATQTEKKKINSSLVHATISKSKGEIKQSLKGTAAPFFIRN